jgi:tetratricopeptide (TPR) repeat protein
VKAIAIVCALVGGLSACVPAQPTALTSAAKAAPSAAALFSRGLAFAASGDALRAEQYLVMARRAGYPEAELIVPLVRVCIASARLRAALAHAEPFLRAHPQASRLRYLVAAIQLALGHPAEAARELRLILAAEPEAAQAHYLLGVTLRDGLHDAAGARASFDAYLRVAPAGPRSAEAAAYVAEATSVPETRDSAARTSADAPERAP